MERIAQFYKVSFEQFKKDYLNTYDNTLDIENIYNDISLPTRATKGSAGYDFITPISFELKPNETIKIVTGIRSEINDGWVLNIFPRSSLGFKYRLQLDNTVGIIDSDYYHSSNEGHIMIKITNHSESTLKLNKGDRFVQGIFLPFGITVDDTCDGIRDGGFGSTNK